MIGASSINKERFCFTLLLFSWLVLDSGHPSLTHASSSENKAHVEEVLIGQASKSISQLPSYIAMNQGFYQREGLKVKTISIRSGVLPATFASGDLHYSGITAAISRFAAVGGAVRVVAVGVMRVPMFLVAHPSVKTPRDLKGKSIAVDTIGQVPELSVRAFLKKHGLDPDRDVTIRAIGGAEERRLAAERGVVGASLVSIPVNSIMKQAGLIELGFTGATIPEQPISGIGVSEKILAQSPDQVKKILRGYIHGLQFLWKNRAETIAIIKKEFNVNDFVAGDALDSFYVLATKDGVVKDSAFDEALEFGVKSGKSPSVSKIRDFSFLREVHKELNIPQQ
jgi:NitT/TauT family transport system substrate-binding protein